MLQRQMPVSTMCSQVARGLGLRIVSGEFQPGDTIPVEAQLCESYGVSRSTIREAIKDLVSKGLIEVSPKIGTRVQGVSAWNLLDSDVLKWRLYSKFDDDIIREIYEIRFCFEPRAAYLTALHTNKGQIQRLEHSMGNIRANRLRPKELVDSCIEMHLAILESSGNTLMVTLGGLVKSTIQTLRHFRKSDNVDWEALINVYAGVYNAIIEREPETARELMTNLLIRSRSWAFAIVKDYKSSLSNAHSSNPKPMMDLNSR